jgi:hypothetical protein
VNLEELLKFSLALMLGNPNVLEELCRPVLEKPIHPSIGWVANSAPASLPELGLKPSHTSCRCRSANAPNAAVIGYLFHPAQLFWNGQER